MHCYLYSTRNGATIIHDLYINLFPYFSKYVHISELIPYSSSIDRREVTSKILSTRVYINLQ